MKTTSLHLVAGILVLLAFYGCSKEERELTINLYSNTPLTQESDQNAGENLISMMAPYSCQEYEIAVKPKVIVHRLDLTNTPTVALEFPLSKGGELRKKLNFLSFKHYAQEFKKNGTEIPNSNLLHKEGDQKPNMNNLNIDATNVWYCCGREGDRQFASIEALLQTLQDSMCSPSFTATAIDLLYTQNVTNKTPIIPATSSEPPTPQIQTMVTAALNELGNADQPTAERIKQVEKYLAMFTADADVMILGHSTDKPIEEPIAVKDYMERISMFKSLESIEVVEALANNEGKVWEIRLKEYHK